MIIEAEEKLPQQAKGAMRNVAFVVEDEARPKHPGERGIRGHGILLGLYEGVPLSRRGTSYFGVLPDKITIFKKPIEELAQGDPEKIKEIVKETVWHEVGHHLGFSEAGIRDRTFASPKRASATRRRERKKK